MGLLFGFLGDFAKETLYIIYESGIFIVFGFLIAGLLQVYLRTDRLVRFLGGKNLKAVINAALIGAPIPLCSCGVVPTAVGLRKKGASREAAISFLISTPETGVDSIAITWGLLGPVFAVVRPIVAVITAGVAGVAHIFLGEESRPNGDISGEKEEGAIGTAEVCAGREPGYAPPEQTATRSDRLRGAMHYAFVKLFDELAFWFLFGMVLTGFLTAVLPDNFLAETMGTGLFSMVVVILVGVPLYMCASSSTPVAVALLAKGLSPGAALVFLLTGPATNGATLSVVGKAFGGRFLRIYLFSIIGVALAAGLLLNTLYSWNPSDGAAGGEGSFEFLYRILKGIGFLLFLYLSARSLHRTGLRPGWSELRTNLAAAIAPIRSFRPSMLITTKGGALATAVLLLIYACGGFYTVEPGEIGIERHFGGVTADDQKPGLHWTFPWPVGRSIACSVEGFVRIDIGFRDGEPMLDPLAFGHDPPVEIEATIDRVPEESLYLTGDENLVDVLLSAHYRVTDASQYALGLEKGEETVRGTLLWALLSEFARRPLDLIFTYDRGDVEGAVLRRGNDVLESTRTGIRLEEVRLLSVHSPSEVHFDFRDVASSQEDRARMIHEANVYSEGVVHGARGEAARVVAEAKGGRARLLADAGGSAAQFLLVEEAARLVPAATRTRLYLETAERVLPSLRTVVRPSDSAVKDFEIWFQTGETRLFSDAPIMGKEEQP